MIRRFIPVLWLLAAFPAMAQQDYQARSAALTGLSRIFGELHHIRRMCEPDRESDAWRERMKRLIDLEQPVFELRENMVGAFNDGYRSAQERFSYCDRAAEDYAAARAVTGEALVASLTGPLIAAERGAQDDSVDVWRGATPQ